MNDKSGQNEESLEFLRRQLAAVNQRLEETEAFKGNFLSNIRNEINNPLTAILGLSAQITSGELSPEDVAGHARMIHHEAFNLDFQLNNICMAAELEAGDAVPFIARVDVTSILEQSLQSLEPIRRGKEVVLELFAPVEIQFASDVRMFHLIVINLLANAFTFCNPKTRVEVAIDSSGDTLTLNVSNRGPELRAEDLERVFDRFRQLESGPSKSHPGHGLGLSVVRALTEQLGGEISLTSPDPEVCRVTVTLPRPDLPEEAQARDGNLIMFDNSELF